MELRINVYKDTGKWYGGHDVTVSDDVHLYDYDFEAVVYENLPAKIGDGYVVVSNADPSSNEFCERLYRYNDLTRSYNMLWTKLGGEINEIPEEDSKVYLRVDRNGVEFVYGTVFEDGEFLYHSMYDRPLAWRYKKDK